MDNYAKTILVVGLCAAFLVGGMLWGGTGTEAALNLSDAASISLANNFTADVNQFKTIKIGQQTLGGVTYFEGTMANSTTDEDGNDNPITVGDDFRADGEMFRIQKGGDDPLKISDSLRPTNSNSYSLGTNDNKWKDLFMSGDATVNGNITQDRGDVGTVKAMVAVNSAGTIVRSAENLDDANPSFTSSRTGIGLFTVDFNFNVNDRYLMISPQGNATAPTSASGFITNNDTANVQISDMVAGGLADQAFTILVY